ncbi:hypothetical protein FSP39_023148 [Pinctada imbricata]|uniref:alpha-L-fucosidase n=1 Tax=Pinctada imbricata TaxID=66713 RepID=A0AA88YFV0_PINIB|nr:hypothetical protein FSP39_023148 [Pinctada imbricata]
MQEVQTNFQPSWSSLDTRTLPPWYDEAKIGIFLNWGVFSVPSYKSEFFWYQWKSLNDSNIGNFMRANYKPHFTYGDFGDMFKAEFFDAKVWAKIIQASRAKYVVVNSKFPDGYTMWPSKYSFSWNSQALGPNKDFIGELSYEMGRIGVHFGALYSLLEWYNPRYMSDAQNHYNTQDFVENKIYPELKSLVETYKPEIVWVDMGQVANSSYWKAEKFLAWLYNESPVRYTVVTNDRWGNDTYCHHGDFWTCTDRYNPGRLQDRKWENAMTIDRKSWGYRREAKLEDFLTIKELLYQVISTVSYGGNILINVGPTAWGTISPIYEERLSQLGDWLSVNEEGIFRSQPWKHQNDTITPGIWYTMAKGLPDLVYVFTLDWPSSGKLELGAPTAEVGATIVYLVGYGDQLKWEPRPGGGMVIYVPTLSVKRMPCNHAWSFRLIYLQDS